MSIKVCVAGATGWAGSAITRRLLASDGFEVVAAIARASAGEDLGSTLGVEPNGVTVSPDLAAAAETAPIDVLVDYTDATTVRERTLDAIARGMHVVIGSSGLTAEDFDEIERRASERPVGVIAAGNFSVTAALAKHFSVLAAPVLRSWEIIDYASDAKIDAPSGTTQELAERLGEIKPSELAVAIEATHGRRDARGATIGGTQVHSVRLPSFTIAFEAIFGLPDERLTIRHDAGSGPEPYVAGTLLAIREVTTRTGLVRGLDRLLFGEQGEG